METAKDVLGTVANIYNWKQFEHFVCSLYKNNPHLKIEQNHKPPTKSGRVREIDVYVEFGYPPHRFSLCVECKYWNRKVDGDVIDVVAAKKEDLNIDKFAIITTVGFEKGANLYAKEKGIDLFLIRPSQDDDFGYSGRILNYQIWSYYSALLGIQFIGSHYSRNGMPDSTEKYLQSLIQIITSKESLEQPDPRYDVFEGAIQNFSDGSGAIKLGKKVFNLVNVIEEARLRYTQLLVKDGKTIFRGEIDIPPDKSTWVFILPDKTAYIFKKIYFDIEYFLHRWDFQVDRAKSVPLMLENVIEQSIIPLEQKDEQKWVMGNSYSSRTIDYKTIPEDVIGSKGAIIKYSSKYPFRWDKEALSHSKGKVYKLKPSGSNQATWQEIIS